MRRCAGLAGLALAWLGLCLAGPALAGEPIRLRIVGGLAGVTQFTQLEKPFWQQEVERLTGGRIVATIHPFDASGLRGQEMLHLMQLGVVPFGTALLSMAAADEPELDLPDLPTTSPDMASLRTHVGRGREHVRRLLRDRHGLELLAIYVYPAQVVFCSGPFRGLHDLVGRRVRTSSVSQSDLVDALGGVSVKLPFAGIAGAMRDGVVDCAITGTRSAIEIGLSDVATHVGDTAITWGLSVFAANAQAWEALPAEIRTTLLDGIGRLEAKIWDRAELDTVQGLACNVGAPECPAPDRKKLQLVHDPEQAGRRRSLLANHVLPRWLERCGPGCAADWERLFAADSDVHPGPSSR